MIKVNVSAEQLKKFKIDQDNCDEYALLVNAGHVSFESNYWAIEFMCRLEIMGIFYTVTRTNEHRLVWERGVQ